MGDTDRIGYLMAGELITADYELEYRGLLVGGDTEYALVDTNLFDLPNVRTSNVDRMHQHGQNAGPSFLGGRVIRMSFEVVSNLGMPGIGAAVDLFKQAFQPTVAPEPLHIRHPAVADGRQVTIDCAAVRISAPFNMEFYEGIPIVVVELEAADPLFYGKDLNYVSGIGLGDASEGLTWPLTWPLEWGTSESSSWIAVNNGTFPASARFTVHGPVVSPRIENVTQAKILRVNETLTAGQTLIIDTSDMTVTLDGGNVFPSIAPGSEWFNLNAPGDQIRFGALSGTGTLDADWKPAWV